MHPTYEAGLLVARDSLGMLRDALDGLPGDALEWRPAPSANPVSVLVTHSLTATDFWLACAAGKGPSREEYLGERRPGSFEERPSSVATLAAAVDQFSAALEALFEGAGEAELAAHMPWKADNGRNMTGAECIVHAVGHLREHVGHVQLTRDLWLGRSSG